MASFLTKFQKERVGVAVDGGMKIEKLSHSFIMQEQWWTVVNYSFSTSS